MGFQRRVSEFGEVMMKMCDGDAWVLAAEADCGEGRWGG